MPTIEPGLRAVLQPILRPARRLAVADRRAWLAELGRSAPVLAETIAQLLDEEESDGPSAAESTRCPTDLA